MERIIRIDTKATWSLTQSLFHKTEIEAEVAENYPDARLEFRNWLTMSFLTSPMSSRAEFAGARTAILGSLWLVGIAVFALPIGIGAAIYLQEYAPRNVEGRKNVFKTLNEKIKANDKTIWFHAASLGEYEQGLPVMEQIRAKYPNHKIVLTFFSPSGYEIRKNNAVADVTVYLPLDTRFNAKKFVALTHPELVFFIKYEYWPNYLKVLKQADIKTYLISGIFREKQAFFKWYGGFYRNALKTFDFFFVQNESSKKLLQSIGHQNVKISGDTRFDRRCSRSRCSWRRCRPPDAGTAPAG